MQTGLDCLPLVWNSRTSLSAAPASQKEGVVPVVCVCFVLSVSVYVHMLCACVCVCVCACVHVCITLHTCQMPLPQSLVLGTHLAEEQPPPCLCPSCWLVATCHSAAFLLVLQWV